LKLDTKITTLNLGSYVTRDVKLWKIHIRKAFAVSLVFFKLAKSDFIQFRSNFEVNPEK